MMVDYMNLKPNEQTVSEDANAYWENILEEREEEMQEEINALTAKLATAEKGLQSAHRYFEWHDPDEESRMGYAWKDVDKALAEIRK